MIRAAQPGDRAGIRAVHVAAFPGPDEARVVDLLIDRGRTQVSLVAEIAGTIAGHILFTPVDTAGAAGTGLAPVAVLPAFQQRGIGSALINAGLAACRAAGIAYAVVLGDPRYYTRFGFEPAARFGLDSEYHAGDAFMALALTGAVPRGLARYASEFAETGV